MSLEQLKQKKIGILGFGQEGQAVLKYLFQHSLSATVYDKNAKQNWKDQQINALSKANAEAITGKNYLHKAIENCEVIFKSPGVFLSRTEEQQLAEKKIILTSQTAWFFKHCPAIIVGVTGTKGKGTTSSLIFEMLKQAHHPAFLTGNISKDDPLSFLETLTENDTVVFELSSFQLEHLKQSSHIGVCLMVTEDHLDYHADRDEYWAAKSSIAKFQNSTDYLIFNADYEGSLSLGQLGQGQKYQISKKVEVRNGAKIKEELETITVSIDGASEDFDVSKRKIQGKHNLENIAAAILAAKCLDLPSAEILKAVENFEGLPHRLQMFASFNEIDFYDDSIATNPDTVLAAARAIPRPLILILGGANKGFDYQEFLENLVTMENLKTIITVGQVGKLITPQLKALNSSLVISGPHKTFEKAVDTACQVAKNGDAVLLSPAATSFDMFESYSQRGDVFQKLVKEFYA